MSFSVQPGRVTGFIGPNGAGKSTAMRVILGLDAPDEGTALVGGQPYRTLHRPLTHVGALLDADALQPSRSGRNHLLWMARSQRISADRVDEVIDMVGLAGAANRKAGGYSLGMRQRLGIAAAMLGDPPIVMMDEPFNGIDPEGIIWMRGFLRSLAAEGRAILISSHLMSELEDVVDHVVVVGRGKVLADATIEELVARASHDTVTVRTDTPADAVAAIQGAGGTASITGTDRVEVAGLQPRRVVEILSAGQVSFSEVTSQRANLEDVYLQLTAGEAEFRAHSRRSGAAMRKGDEDGFAQVLRAEWTKLRTVRGWLIGLVVAAVLGTLLSIVSANGSHSGTCTGSNPAQIVCSAGHPAVPVGPGGQIVADTYELVDRSLDGNGAITARVNSLAGFIAEENLNRASPNAPEHPGLAGWAKAGVIVTSSTSAGAPYAAVMATGGHGVRFQYDYSHDIAGTPGTVSPNNPRWLRLVRRGDALTAYDSTNGSSWHEIGSTALAGLPNTVDIGLFVTSPVTYALSSQGNTTQATARFDHVTVQGRTTSSVWQQHQRRRRQQLLPDAWLRERPPDRRHLRDHRHRRHRAWRSGRHHRPESGARVRRSSASS